MKKLLLLALLVVGCKETLEPEDEFCCYVPPETELNLSNCEYNYGKWNCIDSVLTEIQWAAGSQDIAIDSVLYYVDDILVKKTEINPFLYIWGKPEFNYGEYDLKTHIYITGYPYNSDEIYSNTEIDSIIVNLMQEDDSQP